MPGRRYQADTRVWHVPARPGIRELLKKTLSPVALPVFQEENPEKPTSTESLRTFVQYLERKRCSPNTIRNYTHHVDVNAIKFYIVSVLNKAMPKLSLRPKREKRLPLVLSEEEVSSIIRGIRNRKHKTVITLIYSAGLRVSEAVNLKIQDIDTDRGVITIKQSKGKKDRQVPLSKKFRKLLDDYFVEYIPKTYLFEGQKGGKYSIKSGAFSKITFFIGSVFKVVIP